jgi:hypothetical protein
MRNESPASLARLAAAALLLLSGCSADRLPTALEPTLPHNLEGIAFQLTIDVASGAVTVHRPRGPSLPAGASASLLGSDVVELHTTDCTWSASHQMTTGRCAKCFASQTPRNSASRSSMDRRRASQSRSSRSPSTSSMTKEGWPSAVTPPSVKCAMPGAPRGQLCVVAAFPIEDLRALLSRQIEGCVEAQVGPANRFG